MSTSTQALHRVNSCLQSLELVFELGRGSIKMRQAEGIAAAMPSAWNEGEYFLSRVKDVEC